MEWKVIFYVGILPAILLAWIVINSIRKKGQK